LKNKVHGNLKRPEGFREDHDPARKPSGRFENKGNLNLLSSLYGLLSAITWGVGDFTGGLASRRMGVYRAAFYGEATGLIILGALLAAFREPLPGWQVWMWSALAGAGGSLGLLMFFRAMVEGQMSVAAPVSALMTVILPVIARAIMEGLPGPVKYIGFVLALLAIWLISRGDGHAEKIGMHLADLRLPLLAGVGFGVYFILMHQASQTATIWPLISGRAAGAMVMFFFAMSNHQLDWRGKRFDPLVLLYAAGDVAGNAFYILSGQTGRLDVAAVLSSLYPGTTILLAGMLLHEHLNRSQWLGISAALGAIALMTI
jgi:drug/metabolite transporter (DMT)-like permease